MVSRDNIHCDCVRGDKRGHKCTDEVVTGNEIDQGDGVLDHDLLLCSEPNKFSETIDSNAIAVLIVVDNCNYDELVMPGSLMR